MGNYDPAWARVRFHGGYQELVVTFAKLNHLEESLIEELDVAFTEGMVDVEENEAHMGEMEWVTDILEHLKIPYDRSWDKGFDFVAGEERARQHKHESGKIMMGHEEFEDQEFMMLSTVALRELFKEADGQFDVAVDKFEEMAREKEFKSPSLEDLVPDEDELERVRQVIYAFRIAGTDPVISKSYQER